MHYKFVSLISGLISLLFALIALSLFIAASVEDYRAFEAMTQIISSVGALLGGFAALVAAVAACYGINAWKKQLRYQRELSIIWDALSSVRKVQLAWVRWLAFAMQMYRQVDITNGEDPTEKDLVTALEVLAHLFGDIDQLIVRNEFEWSNYATELRNEMSAAKHLIADYQKNRHSAPPLESKILDPSSKVMALLRQLDEHLCQLKDKYR